MGTVSPSSDTGTTHVTYVKVPCCQLSCIPYVFKHCDLALKIIISWEAVCITLYSQNPNTTFKIRFWVFTHGLWRAVSSEHRVMPSKLMKRGWKYPLKHQKGGEGTPLKDSTLGALMLHARSANGHTQIPTWTQEAHESWQLMRRSLLLSLSETASGTSLLSWFREHIPPLPNMKHAHTCHIHLLWIWDTSITWNQIIFTLSELA